MRTLDVNLVMGNGACEDFSCEPVNGNTVHTRTLAVNLVMGNGACENFSCEPGNEKRCMREL